MLTREYYDEWTAVGELIADGGLIGRSDLYAIYDNLDIGHIRPDYLPTEKNVNGKTSERKIADFLTVQKLWDHAPDDWLVIEQTRLKEAREISGSTETGGKDSLYDVVSTEILLRIFAAAKLVTEDKYDKEISDEAIRALNLYLSEVCARGRTRMMMIDGQSVYSKLKKGGLLIGSGGRYLPNPKRGLPFLLVLLNKESVNPDAYQK